MLQTLPPTPNFIVQFDDAIPHAEEQAAALWAVVESEYLVLTDIFQVTGAFGPGNPLTLQLNVRDGAGFWGLNHGYQPAGPMTISLTVHETVPGAIAAQRVKAAFVAEFVELLMSYNRLHGSVAWNPAYSDGEALSQFMALERFPPLNPTSIIFSWLTVAGRPDWGSTNDPTDQNPTSYGCGVLFLYYLKSQLGLSVAAIVRSAGASLEDTYRNLTGQTGGYAAMTALLDEYLPLSDTLFRFTDGRNDLFPLLDYWDRQLWLTVQTSSQRRPHVLRSSTAERHLVGCPARVYQYRLVTTAPMTTCVASTYGFGQPVYNWSVHGTKVSSDGQIEVPLLVSDPDPNAPVASGTVVPVMIDCRIVNLGMQSSLVMTFPGTVGVIDLIVEVSAAERVFQPQESTATSRLTPVATEAVVWSPDYRRDRTACLARFAKDLQSVKPPFDWLSWDIAVLLTLPDPPPEELRASLRTATGMAELKDRLRGDAPPAVREGIAKHLAEWLRSNRTRDEQDGSGTGVWV